MAKAILIASLMLFLTTACGDMWVEEEHPCHGIGEEETWEDPDTGYEWQNPAPDETYEWQEAIDYCYNLTWAGHSDWKLPSKEELESILTESKHYGCYWKTGLCGKCSWFWSSSSSAGDTDYAWGVSFRLGYVGGYHKSNNVSARGVRGGP